MRNGPCGFPSTRKIIKKNGFQSRFFLPLPENITMEKLYSIYLQYPYISTDTRNVIPDSIFFCLKGEHFDGNQFAKEALNKGAKYAVVDDIALQNTPNCILVDDVLQTLQQLALHHRKQLHIPFIGITGTNGKTTTKELLTQVLSKKYKVCSTKGNLNNHIGVPLTLLSIRPDDEIAIVEMGANHLGEIAELCKLSLPNYGIVTNIGKAHIEGFGSLENIIITKKALYQSVVAACGTIFLNADDLTLSEQLHYDKIVKYSQKQPNTLQGYVEDMNPYLAVNIFGKSVPTHVTGAYNLYNILCAATVGQYFQISIEAIAEAISEYNPVNNRSQIDKRGDITIISDYYNANPTSMEAALRNLSELSFTKKRAILGDMLELGAESEKEHLHIIELCQSLNVEAVFVGAEFYKANTNKTNCFKTVEEYNDDLHKDDYQNSIVLVKGSRGIHLERLILLQK